LETAEVAEKPMRSQLQKLAQVFRTDADGAKSEALVMLTIAEAKELKPGQPVLLKAADSNNETPGKLGRVDESTRVALGQVEGLLQFTDGQRRSPVGAFLTATFAAKTKNALVVPITALLTAADGTFVYVINGKHFTRTKIKTGAASDGYIEVEEGLYPGDQVVAKGVDNLWLIELSALKGGKPCCAVPKKQA
jgi:HlyD family secretion protein